MKYDRSKYKVKNWKNFTYLHWIINPGLAINELILGQRIPKIILIDKTSDRPLMERTYIPCPHCHTLHDGRTWSKKNGTYNKNWFGYYCPKCGNIIPCLHNGLAFLLLAITFPFWGWFKDDLKEKWLKAQPKRYQNIQTKDFTYNDVSWTKIGVKFGSFMFVFMAVFGLLQNPGDYLQILLIVLPATALGGLIFGLTMKFWMGRKGRKQHKPG